jgi:DNA-binding IclR family transcriptional regulator
MASNGGSVKTTRRLLQVLQLFTIDSPEWSIDAAGRKLGLSQSTAYDYFRDLVDAALLVKSRTGFYIIGPAVIVYDRLTRDCDPVIALAQPLMKSLTVSSGVECVALLCRLYRMTVLCVDQETIGKTEFAVSYERGRPMPLFRGAASKIILAHVERRKLRRYYDEFADDISKAELGRTWTEFKASLRRIRAANIYVTAGELDVGLVGISAPIFSAQGEILGSISLVVSEQALRRTKGLIDKLGSKVGEAGRALTDALGKSESVVAPISSHKKMTARKSKKRVVVRKTRKRRAPSRRKSL